MTNKPTPASQPGRAPDIEQAWRSNRAPNDIWEACEWIAQMGKHICELEQPSTARSGTTIRKALEKFRALALMKVETPSLSNPLRDAIKAIDIEAIVANFPPARSDMVEAERTKFEAWFNSAQVRGVWEAWQAAIAASTPQASNAQEPVVEWVNEEQGFQYLTHDRLLAGTKLYTHPIDRLKAESAPSGEVESIAKNHDAMIILTQGYPTGDVTRIVDAHVHRQVAAALARRATAGATAAPSKLHELIQQLRAAANRPTMPGREPGSILVHANLLRIAADELDHLATSAAAPGDLPPLPEFGINTASHAHIRVTGFTADQMREYGRSCIASNAVAAKSPNEN